MPTIWLVNLTLQAATMKVLKWLSTDLAIDTVYICILYIYNNIIYLYIQDSWKAKPAQNSRRFWSLSSLLFSRPFTQLASKVLTNFSPGLWFWCHCNVSACTLHSLRQFTVELRGQVWPSHFPHGPARTSQWISGELEVAELRSAHKYWSLRSQGTEIASWR